ncbi:MAG: hypothetical protein GY715_03515, partial [Planctomycetes bacterium]|nr:hypothetical protein [Planctomycetota bacterium]
MIIIARIARIASLATVSVLAAVATLYDGAAACETPPEIAALMKLHPAATQVA